MRGSIALATLVATLATAGAARAAEPYDYTVALSVGVGGTDDADPAPGFDGSSYQLGLGMVIADGTLLGLRLGRVSLGDALEGLADPDLEYATVAGEYRFPGSFYDAGMFLGLGAYDLAGDEPDGSDGGETAAGVTFGVTGDFRVTRRFALLVELSAHWVDFEDAQLFGTAHAGVALHF